MITYAMLTNKGGRTINEDCVGVLQNHNGTLAVLADGLGGHGQGEVASEIAVKSALSQMENRKEAEQLLSDCIIAANSNIVEEQKKQGKISEIKTTVNLLYLNHEAALWTHVGDSRTYFFKKGKLVKRTLDHSVPQMLVVQGEIKEQDIRFHEDRNRLIRVLGMSETTPKFDISEKIILEKQQSFLVCSDGFWELINEKDMLKTLRNSDSPEAWLQEMEKTILQNGKDKNMDNYSAIAIFVR